VFDFRYHVASLAAVFLALVVGIVVGVGISGKGIIKDSERQLLENQINILTAQVQASEKKSSSLKEQQKAAQTFANTVYEPLMANRLRGKRVAVLVVGPAGGGTHKSVDQALSDGGAIGSLRVLRVPIDPESVRQALGPKPQLAKTSGREWLPDLGKALAQELAAGGRTPLWDRLSGQLVSERQGRLRPTDGVVVLRTARPQSGATARFLAGLYSGLGGAGVPAVGVETTDAKPSTVAVWETAGLSSVDDVDTPVGKLALAVLLAGGEHGLYGVKKSADDVLPPVEPVAPTVG
jgi:Copper transport outer membrane protein, MctB